MVFGALLAKGAPNLVSICSKRAWLANWHKLIESFSVDNARAFCLGGNLSFLTAHCVE